jgi:RNA polymerase sigma factor (sigma-70 family)
MEPWVNRPENVSAPRGAELEVWFQNEVRPHETEMRRMLGDLAASDDIDDLVQESFLRLLRMREKVPVFHPRALLLGIARNAAFDLYRRRRTARTNSVGENEHLDVPDEGPSTQDIVSLRQENILLEEAIRDLPSRCREVLVLRRLEGLSQKEAAERLKISVKTVDAQLTRALKRCAAYLSKHGIGPRAQPRGGK